MRLRQIKNIFAKEMLDTLRDRRTILIMIVIPVLLYPGLMIFMNELATAQQAKMERKTLKVAVVNIPENSELIKRLRSTKGIEVFSIDDPIAAVKDGTMHYVLSGSIDWQQMEREGKTATIQLQYDRANDDAGANLDRIRRIVDLYEQDLVLQRLKEKGISEEFVKPLRVQEINVASKQKMGGFIIGRLLPMFMVFMVLVGSIYPAIDMTAGEKERGTLETILTSPATKTEIVLGKFLTVIVIALITGLLNLGSMMATFTFGLFKALAATVQIKIPLSTFFIMVSCLVPLAVFFSGVMMALSSFARSFKEAQGMITPFYLVATFPAMVSVVPGIRLEGFWLTLPIANVTLLFKELMLGVFDMNHILIVLFCTLFLASVAIFLAIKLFGREEVLFGEASSFSLAWKRSNIVGKPTPGPSEAFFFTMLSMAFLLYLAIPMQANDLVQGLILTELLIFLLLPIAFAAYLKFDFKSTFSIRTPSVTSLASTILFFAGIFFSIGTIVYIQNQLFPIPKEFEDYIQKAMKTLYDRSFFAGFVLIAILPAVCEEATFRGVILSGMLSRFKPYTAVLLNAFLFGVFHLSLHRFPGVFLIGFAAAWMVWRSRSIFTGMLLHMLCNGYMTLLFKYPQLDWLGLLQGKPSILLLILGIGCIAAGVMVMNRFRGGLSTRSAPPESR